MIARRGFLTGLTALLAAPAIVRTPGLLMPVRRVLLPGEWYEMGVLNYDPNTAVVDAVIYHNHRVYQQTKGAWYQLNETNGNWARWNQALPWQRDNT